MENLYLYKVSLNALIKICLYFLLFILSVFVLSFDYYCGKWVIFVLWVFGFIFIPRYNFVGFYFYLAFGLFFIVPIVLNGVNEYLSEGQLVHAIHLEESEVLTLLLSIVFFVGGFVLFSLFQRLFVEKSNYYLGRCDSCVIKNKSIFHLYMIIGFSIVSIFYLVKILAIQKYGYLAYHRGELPVEKSFFLLLIEFSVLSGLVFGIYKKKNIFYFMLVVYGVLIMLTGQRMPGATIIFLSSLYCFTFLRRHAVVVVFASILFVPPVMNLIQYYRFFGIDGITVERIFNYNDIFKVLGITIDTLKAAIDLDGFSGMNISLFYKPISIFYIFLERVFGLNVAGFKLSLGSFGAVSTNYYSPELFEKGVTFGSSAIAEAMYHFGFWGVFLSGMAFSFMSGFFSRMAVSDSVWGALLFFVFSPRLFSAVRSDLIGWFFDGVIIFVFCGSFMFLMNYFFEPLRGRFGGEGQEMRMEIDSGDVSTCQGVRR